MQIQITGQGLELTDAMRSYVEKKFQRIVSIADKINHVHVTFRVEKVNQIAEANLSVPGSQIHAEASSENIYESIDKLVDKLSRQLKKYKSKLTDHS